MFAVTLGLTIWGVISARRSQLDALPDLSDTQVIVATEWMGRNPKLIEDQVTYPITTTFLGAPKVKTVRGFTMFGMSFVYVVFENGTDLYWARSRVVEYLARVRDKLPAGVNPQIGPDATSIGWIFQYALVDQTNKHSLQELRSFQDWYLRYWLQSVPGVAEVASVGGYEKEYQIQIDDSRGTPIRIRDVADVTIGGNIRRGLTELDGRGELVGGIVVMRSGENALDVIQAVKAKLAAVQSSLPPGVKVVPVYDRSQLIHVPPGYYVK